MPQQILTVIGATGIQGGSVIDTLLNSGRFHVRGTTRNAASEAAVALAARGVESVEADNADNFRYPMFMPTYFPTADKWVQMADVRANTMFPIVNARRNTGSIVMAVLDQPARTRGGMYVSAYMKWSTYKELLQEWAVFKGVNAQFVQIPSESYHELWPGWANEMTPMSKFFEQYGKEAWTTVDGDVLVEPEDLGLTDEMLGTVEESIKDVTPNRNP